MANAVGRAVLEQRHLVVQAGTGTGKSLAYIVPAVLSGRKVVVATATKALQDQLAEKDLPATARSLDRPVAFAVLKGRSNYLCRQRAAEIDGRGVQQQLDDSSVDDELVDVDIKGTDVAGNGDGLVDHVRRILDWAKETESGDRADLPFEPHTRAWSMLSVGPRECPGAFRCPSGGTCFAEKARNAAAAADVVVVNTHLYGSHLASGGAVLPEHDVVVFDEAHEVEEVMTSSLGAEITPGRFRALAAMARPVLDDDDARRLATEVGDLAGPIDAALRPRVGTRVLVDPTHGDETDGRERRRPPPAPVDDEELTRLLELAAARLEALTGSLRAAPAPDAGADGAARRARALQAAGHLGADVARIAARTNDEVAWVDGTPRSPVLRLSPIDVGPVLAAQLWGSVTAVLTSATVPPRVTERLGLVDFPLDELDVGSPFDYRSHALLYVARHLPDRRRPESEPALHEELAALITAAGGRTLALFTSHRATEAAAAALRPVIPYRLLEQGDLPKGRLLAEFAEDETSCLFATLGFWQGVDVPGPSLSLVTLDRLPFPRPDDPLLSARRDRAGDAAFAQVDLPRASTLLAQGAGRLVRAADDRGVVAVLDPRLATASYRGVLLARVPPMRRTTERRQAEDFLHRILTPAAVDGAPQ
jgi:ATP-dependent DNA helicase DinG